MNIAPASVLQVGDGRGFVMPDAQIDQDIVAVAILRARLEELQEATAFRENRIPAAVERGEVPTVQEVRP
jgi:hypothetical protein